MSRLIRTTEELIDYVARVGAREHPALRRCREQTARLPNANMQIAPEQGAFLALLAKILGARQTLEIGTFTGYSALYLAEGLIADGELHTIELREEDAATASNGAQASKVPPPGPRKKKKRSGRRR